MERAEERRRRRPVDLASRECVAERMDDPDLARAEHERALVGLAKLNRLAGVARGMCTRLEAFARAKGLEKLRVLDLACGGGDNALALVQLARRRGLELECLGLDLSPVAVELARARAQRAGMDEHAGLRFARADVLHDPWPEGVDAVVSSLFLHHLGEDQILTLFARLRSEGPQLFSLVDLARSRFGYALAAWIPPLVTGSEVVRLDARLSVRAAFTSAELLDLAHRAGLTHARVERRFPARLELAGGFA